MAQFVSWLTRFFFIVTGIAVTALHIVAADVSPATALPAAKQQMELAVPHIKTQRADPGQREIFVVHQDTAVAQRLIVELAASLDFVC